jgi:hypothetical protein
MKGFIKNNRDQQVFNIRKSLGFPVEKVIKVSLAQNG